MAGQALRPFAPGLDSPRAVPRVPGWVGHGEFGTQLGCRYQPVRYPDERVSAFTPSSPQMRAERVCMRVCSPVMARSRAHAPSHMSRLSRGSLVRCYAHVMSALAWLGVRTGRGNGGSVPSRRSAGPYALVCGVESHVTWGGVECSGEVKLSIHQSHIWRQVGLAASVAKSPPSLALSRCCLVAVSGLAARPSNVPRPGLYI